MYVSLTNVSSMLRGSFGLCNNEGKCTINTTYSSPVLGTKLLIISFQRNKLCWVVAGYGAVLINKIVLEIEVTIYFPNSGRRNSDIYRFCVIRITVGWVIDRYFTPVAQ